MGGSKAWWIHGRQNPLLSVMAPKATLDEIARRLEGASGQAMRQPAFVNGIKDLRLTANYPDSKEMTEYVSRNYDAFARLLEELGLSK